MLTQAPRGTYDLYGRTLAGWKFIEKNIEEVCAAYNFDEVRTPIFEHTELFLRSVGDTTDVVQKEMYSFEDKGGRNITLRPEWTAGVGRAYIEHAMFNDPQPTKLFYVGPCFRYEKPQAGRDRQFYQFGCEMYGSDSFRADAEVMGLAYGLFKKLGLKNITLHLNSLGCPDCRKRYNELLKDYFASRESELCETCRERLKKNPLRILDCKSPVCGEIVKQAPRTLDNLCPDCKEHFENLCSLLDEMGIPHVADAGIVRGLDYYTRTVFEFVCDDMTSGSTICGGGRYDNLIDELGGAHTPAVGFAMGMGRLLMAMEAAGISPCEKTGPTIYIGSTDAESAKAAQKLVTLLREEGIKAEHDLLGRSVKAQMKFANKIAAKFTTILGETELAEKACKVKNMEDGSEVRVTFEDLASELKK